MCIQVHAVENLRSSKITTEGSQGGTNQVYMGEKNTNLKGLAHSPKSSITHGRELYCLLLEFDSPCLSMRIFNQLSEIRLFTVLTKWNIILHSSQWEISGVTQSCH